MPYSHDQDDELPVDDLVEDPVVPDAQPVTVFVAGELLHVGIEAPGVVVMRRVADPQLAADLTADVFLAVIEAAAGYRGSFGGPRTWLYGIARNVIAAEFRRSGRQRRAEGLIAGRRLLGADDIDRLAAKIDASRRVRELHARLQALPETERSLLELVAVDGLTPGD
jgi:RNA polymerase sigma factor (sigma-70 family)